MLKSINTTLDDHFDEFIEMQIKAGRYGSVSETVLAGLRLLEAQENRLSVTRQALKEVEASGLTDYSLDGITSELETE
ncbi:MAG: type II toxin-antitoxin system ParD family antitoxin [Cyanobacteria bacterium P01_H01_bin.74]